MICAVCNIQYVGKIENTLNLKCRGHESNMRHNDYNPVAVHYRRYNHTIDDILICVVGKDSDENKRLSLKEVWMILIDTLTPKGMNSRW